MKKINYIPEDKDKDLTLTWFYDDIPEEFRQVRKNVQGLEEEYLELRQLLQETAERLQNQPTDVEIKARSRYLKKRITDIEKKFPWLVAEQVLEYALWGVPH
jgi:hypothetical protein